MQNEAAEVGPAAPNGARTIRWVVPAYNEEASIEDLIDRIAEISNAEGWRWELLVVDDGSHDRTGELAKAKGETLPVTVVRNEPNMGLGRTIRRGLREASQAAGPDDVIVTLDADLTQDPSFSPSMLARLDEGFDVVIASRYQKGSAVEGLSSFRKTLSYGASGIVTLVRPVRGVRDYSCGYRAYRAQIIREAFERDGENFVSEPGFACMLEIAERLRGFADFAEVPFTLRYHEKRKESAIKIVPTIGAYFRVIAKVAVTTHEPVPFVPLMLAFMSIMLGAAAQLLLRAGAKSAGGASLLVTLGGAFSHWQVIAGFVLYALSSLSWLVVLSRLDLTVAYPLGASGYILVVLLAWFAGETVPPLRWLGVLLIVMGVLLVGWLGVSPRKKVVA